MAATAPRRKFKSKNAKAKPFDFDLDGYTYKVHGQISGIVLLELMESFSHVSSSAEEDGEESGFESISNLLPAFRRFFSSALLAEDRDRFFEHLEDSNRPVDFETLSEIISWLSSIYAGGRPLDTAEESSENS